MHDSCDNEFNWLFCEWRKVQVLLNVSFVSGKHHITVSFYFTLKFKNTGLFIVYFMTVSSEQGYSYLELASCLKGGIFGGNMPWHFYDKQTYFKLQSLVEICLHRTSWWQNVIATGQPVVTFHVVFFYVTTGIFHNWISKLWTLSLAAETTATGISA